MKYILATVMVLGMLVCSAQETKKTYKVVLMKDSIQLFDKKYAPMQFGPSYFVCKIDYNYSFTDSGFKNFADKAKAQNTEIVAFKSSDNKSMICIFPKLSTRGIYDLQEFIAKNFDESVMSQAKAKYTVHVQVVDGYDPHDLPATRGFSYN